MRFPTPWFGVKNLPITNLTSKITCVILPYGNYPVVGVNWLQANDYCSWRTDRVNEQILVSRGVWQWTMHKADKTFLTTKTYLAGMYQGSEGKNPYEDANGNNRRIRWKTGFYYPVIVCRPKPNGNTPHMRYVKILMVNY